MSSTKTNTNTKTDDLIKLGNEYRKIGALKEAANSFHGATQIDSSSLEAHINLASTLIDLGNLDEAAIFLEVAKKIDPHEPVIYIHAGHIEFIRGNYKDAITHFTQAAVENKQYSAAYQNIALSYQKLEDFTNAEKFYEKALKINPKSELLLSNFATLFQIQGKYNEAIDLYERSLKINPKFHQSHNNLGIIYITTGNTNLAEQYFKKAYDIFPQYKDAVQNLSQIYLFKKQFGKAKKILADSEYQKYPALLATYINTKYYLCDWTQLNQLEPMLDLHTSLEIESQTKTSESPFLSLLRKDSPQHQQKIAIVHANYYKKHVTPHVHTKTKKAGQRIKLGYISADIMDHVMAHQIIDLFKHHDRTKFEIYLYVLNPPQMDPLYQEFKKLSDFFVDLSAENSNVAAQIISDHKIDILIDLNGHTWGNRMSILAHKPAPIQISYLGFPGTTGADFIDYFIADSYLINTKNQDYFTEKILNMPGSYQINSLPKFRFEQKQDKINHNLPEKAFVFASFNHAVKITKEIFDTWMDLLKIKKGSVLWLYANAPETKKSLRNYAKSKGIQTSRIIFATQLDIDKHIARLVHVDLFLDTYPYNGGATSAHALYTSKPLVTISGDSYVSRMSGSILTSLNMPELITTNHHEYLKLALSLATNPKLHRQTVKKIKQSINSGPTYDTKLFTKNLETVLENILRERY